MQKIIKFSLLVLLVSNVNATMMPNKIAEESENSFENTLTIDVLLKIHEYEREVSKEIGREIENIVKKEVNVDNKVWNEQQERFLAQSDERMKEVDNCLPRTDLKKMLEASKRRQKERKGELLYWKDIRAKRLARMSKKLKKDEIENIIYEDDLAAFEKITCKDISITQDEMLRQACMYGSPKIALHFVKAGADVNYRDKYSETPLHYAVRNQDTKLVEVLIEEGANVNYKNCFGRTPLYGVLETGDISLAKLLIQEGADINSKDKDNMTVLEVGLWLNTLVFKLSGAKIGRLKVVDYIKSVIEEKKRLNRAGIIRAGEDLYIYPV